jgi:hypothetical protein
MGKSILFHMNEEEYTKYEQWRFRLRMARTVYEVKRCEAELLRIVERVKWRIESGQN